ncbi:MAG: hypothetical protein QOJ87_1810 [Verrucomicrobiota bacterium]|jgi:hypothetical protein
MESDPALTEFVELGTYSVMDLERLLPALDAAEVNYRVELRDGVGEITPFVAGMGGAFGQGARGTVRIAPNEKEIVRIIHTDLFGDCLPNYDSEFFRDHGYVEPDEDQKA